MAVLGDGPDTTTFLVSFVIHVKYYKLVFMFQKLVVLLLALMHTVLQWVWIES